MSTEKLETWLTKTQAAARLGRSEKTVERLVKQGRIERRDRPRPGRLPESVYNPADVEALIAERIPRDFAPEETARTPVVPVTKKLFLTLAEASEFSGLSQDYLKRLIEAGELQTVQDGKKQKIRRRDLDKL